MIPLERAFRVLRAHMYIIRVAYIQSGIIVMIDDPMEDLSILGSGNRATLASFYSEYLLRALSARLVLPFLAPSLCNTLQDTIVCTCFLLPTLHRYAVHIRSFGYISPALGHSEIGGLPYQ